jgi:hypothetical protein
MVVARITTEDLKRRRDSAASDCPLLLNVRLEYPREHSMLKLPGAVRLAPDELVSGRLTATLIRPGFRAHARSVEIGALVRATLPTDTKHAPRPSSFSMGSSQG